MINSKIKSREKLSPYNAILIKKANPLSFPFKNFISYSSV